jgi:signal transduction histidine kinase/DNA-binding response OmpR family regulator/ligand-binding sensor domain-containing protein
MWVITPNEILCYTEDLNAIEIQFNEDIQFLELTSMRIDSSNNHLWVASDNGFFHFNIEMNSLDMDSNVAHLGLINHYLPGRRLNKHLFDRNGAIWLTEDENGLYRFILDNHKVVNIEHFTKDSYSDHSLKGNMISCLFEDRQGGIWAGVHNYGLNYYNPNNIFFQNFSEQSGLPGDHVISACKYDSERVIIGTYRKGIGVYNSLHNRIEQVWFDASNLSNSIISCIFVDSRGIIWIGAEGCLYYLHPGTSKVVPHRQINTVLNSNPVQAIGEDDDGHIWIGHRRGLMRFGLRDNGELIDYINFNDPELNPERIINSTIKSIYNDPADNSMWVGSYYNGLYKFTPKQDVISGTDYIVENYTYNRYNTDGLQSNFISGILRDSCGRLWLATEGGGLSQLVDTEGYTRFVNYTENEGLSHNVTKAIIEDNNGKLFIPTNSKLNYFDPETGRFIHYGIKSGLKSIYFTSSAIKTDNGKVVFGGNLGLSIINLESVDTKPELIKPYFGRFFLFSEEVRPGQVIDKQILLNSSLYYNDEINLAHNQNSFSVELSGVGYLNTEHSVIRYRLQGYDKDWIYHNASDGRLASYNKVPPGSYTLEYGISDASGDWDDHIKSLSITISPIFWRTNLAIIFYIIALCLIVYYSFYILLKIERLKGRVLITQMEKEKEHSISEAKLKFFTNISHEFRTPLTLINGPVEHILSNYKLDDFLRHNLFLIKKQTNYLLRLLDQLLEFRKAEKGALELKWYKTDIIKFVWQITKSFDSLAIKNNIQFEYLSDKPEIMLYFDPKMIEKVIYNLLSNAFKFTPGPGKISLHIQDIKGSFVRITVRDTGPGISDDEIERIFESFFQGKNTNNIHGTGIGLSLSRVLVQLHGGKIYAEKGVSCGAQIIVEIPLGKDHLKDNNIIRDDTLTPSEIYIDLKEDDPSNQIDKNPPITNCDDKQKMVIVDDNMDMRNFIADIFQDEFTVFQYADGKIALNRIKKIRPDIVISDLMMPVMDGLELCKELRSDPATNHTLFIILTGQYSSELRIRLLQQGADDFIIKPFQVDYLRIKVKNMIENRSKIKTRYNRHFIKKHIKNNVDKHGEEFLYTVSSVIQRNIANINFTNDDFSRALAMSSTKFYQKLKMLTGKSPNELIRDYRVRKAAELLSNEDYTIDEVIGMCGFCSRPYFYKCFREVYKMTPLQYKTQSSNKHLPGDKQFRVALTTSNGS